MTKSFHKPSKWKAFFQNWHVPVLCLSFWVLTETPLLADVRITEFVADNDGSYLDEDGDSEDWIEIYNDSSASVDLSGWSLTDDEGNLKKWVFPPGTILSPREYRIIFASGKNRRTVDRPFHTNFSLRKAGEFLGLVRADGSTVEHSYGPSFPPQYEGMSYGLDQPLTATTVISSGASGSAGVPLDASDFSSNYTNWNSEKSAIFTGGSWQSVTTGVGFERSAGYGTWLGSDLETEMFGINSSVFLRIPFEVSDVSNLSSLLLRMRWDDGFVAYINGVEVAADRNPETLQWNSTSTGLRNDGLNEEWATFPLSTSGLGLVEGTNLLAIHGLNQGPSSSDMLVLPELDLIRSQVTAIAAYQVTPSPGEANGTGILEVPPFLKEVTDRADRPPGGPGSEPISITAEVIETENPISSVRVFYRLMFGNEVQLSMNDSGTGADETADDGIYSSTLPTTGLAAGQMIRWRVEVEDSAGRVTRAPAYLDPLDSDRYFGTVAMNASLSTSRLPVLETFVEDEVAVNTRGGTRSSVYFLGEFYDNVQMDLHGQSTSGFPKKSYDLDFNRGNRFRWDPGEERVKDINLLTNWADKSKSRNSLAYEFLKNCGTAYHYAFPVRVERNGAFFSTADMVEDGDDRFLERIGLDGNGSLYKMYDKLVDPNRASKKTRKEEGKEDIAALIAGIDNTLPRDTRRLYAYDNLDLPATVNYLAALVVVGISDNGHKNYYMYRDTEGDGEWRPLPWDVDLSAGRRWNRTDRYFDDTLFNNLWVRNPNRLWELIHNTPEYRDMYMRRLRTLIDEVLLPPGTPYADDWYSRLADELVSSLDPEGISSDADLDYTKWGSWGNNNQVRAASARILSEWLPAKRSYLFDPARVYSGESIPPTQAATPNLTIETVDFLPDSGNQEEEYLVLKNRETGAVDLSGWTLSGAIDFTFPPGTVLPPGDGSAQNDYIGLLHVARNPVAFRARTDAVSGGQYRFVEGGYDGQLSAHGENIELRNKAGGLVATKTYSGSPSPAQEHLRITEVMYHPEPDDAISPDSQDFEFVELRNTSGSETLDLTGIRFDRGIQFDFTGSSITSLSPGDYVLVVSNRLAFEARHGGSLPVAGEFVGSLNNGGERLRLIDPVAEEILDFEFKDSWYPLSDGAGFSLVIRNELSHWNTWGEKQSWRLSAAPGGSPGTNGTPADPGAVLINEILAHTDLPEIDSIELFNPGNDEVDLGGWYLSDDFSTPQKFRIPDGTTIAAGGFLVFDETDFFPGPDGFRLSEYGEQVYLFSANAAGTLTGYSHGWDFPATPNGISLGRHVDSQGKVHLVLQESTSLGLSNPSPAVGPVVVTEIHYRPPDLPVGVDRVVDEFVELTNISNSSVPLYHTDISVPGYGTAALNDTWRLRNAVDFDFPPGVTMEPGESIVVVSFDPSSEPSQLAAFRSRFTIPDDVHVFGPWSGKLDNSGEEIELKSPGSADPLESFFVPYYTLEEIDYRDTAPWPESADGAGDSLHRITDAAFGNDPENWEAKSPTPGVGRDSDRDQIDDAWELLHGLVVGTDDAGLDPDRDGFTNLEEFLARTLPFDPNSFLYLLVFPTPTGLGLQFPASPEVAYTIEYTDSLLSPNWQMFQQIDSAVNPRNLQFEIEPTGSQRFFRITTPPVGLSN